MKPIKIYNDAVRDNGWTVTTYQSYSADETSLKKTSQ